MTARPVTWRPRASTAFRHALLALLPTGAVWPRQPGTVIHQLVAALASVNARWAARVGVFLQVESYPPMSIETLPDWERVLGLPEECIPVGVQTLPERQQAVEEKLARRPGRQDRAYFLDLGRRLGYWEPSPSPYQLPLQLPGMVGQLRRMRITEYRPFMAGVSRCGDPSWSIAPHKMRFVWRVVVPGARTTWFRCGTNGGRAGTDPHMRIARADDLECILRKLKPAHTHLIFSYTGN